MSSSRDSSHNTWVVEVHFQTIKQHLVNLHRSVSSERVSIPNRRPIVIDIVTTASTENLYDDGEIWVSWYAWLQECNVVLNAAWGVGLISSYWANCALHRVHNQKILLGHTIACYVYPQKLSKVDEQRGIYNNIHYIMTGAIIPGGMLRFEKREIFTGENAPKRLSRERVLLYLLSGI